MAYNPQVNAPTTSVNSAAVALPADQTQFTTPLNVTLQERATGGATAFHFVTPGGTNLTNVNASNSPISTKIIGWFIYNNATSARKVIFYDALSTTSITVGGSNPAQYFSLVIPASSGANVSMPAGIQFNNGIRIATVTGIPDNDASPVTVYDLSINIFYK